MSCIKRNFNIFPGCVHIYKGTPPRESQKSVLKPRVYIPVIKLNQYLFNFKVQTIFDKAHDYLADRDQMQASLIINQSKLSPASQTDLSSQSRGSKLLNNNKQWPDLASRPLNIQLNIVKGPTMPGNNDHQRIQLARNHPYDYTMII